MKTKLLFIFLLTCQLASAQFYLNEVMLDPPGTPDAPHNFIEIRGAASTPLTNMYIVTIEGDGDSDEGRVDEVIDISTFSTGTNGYFVAAQTGNFYNINPDATVALDLFSGDVESQSHTIMLIQTATPPSTGNDIDPDEDGTPDGSIWDGWTVLDSVTLLKDNSQSTTTAVAYSTVVFLENNEATTPTVIAPVGATIISTPGTQFDYAGRIGNSTGDALTNDALTSDWVGSDLPSSATPSMAGDFWVMSSSSSALRAYPESFEGSELNHIGGPNPSQNTLSNDEFALSNFKIYPNPAKDYITIETNNVAITSIVMYDILGKNVFAQSELTNNRINVSDFNSGLYFVKIESSGNSITKKLIIE
ncbi:T9SS type A sorting domain-containing protein [uncultured Psychroserpens sp.]|uniref:T9SS type A sorting domain-containing protein n=1 Tax=uncultured Psychroserpens sp. TaxID=255436 RepID=UPI0026388864|nr:T9SS type A sorting domain-containing protein [uncultured Psychroserpens sp.]